LATHKCRSGHPGPTFLFFHLKKNEAQHCSREETATVTFVLAPQESELHNYYNPPGPRLLGWNQITSKLQTKGENIREFFQA
jgi:hypothetical protein